MYRIKLI